MNKKQRGTPASLRLADHDSKKGTKAREFSAGAVVLRKLRGRWHIAVIEPQSRYGKRNNGDERNVVALPKGSLDADESAQQAALREVEEETGVRAEKIAKLADVRYIYVRAWRDHARVSKVVRFFLFRYHSGRIGAIQPEMRREVARAFWLPLEDAPKRLSYAGERQVAAKALRYLRTHESEIIRGRSR
jgi:8-oxo-dGTP pyrophosphatase MutT (NUDIX family)